MAQSASVQSAAWSATAQSACGGGTYQVPGAFVASVSVVAGGVVGVDAVGAWLA